ncbi:MAG: ABC transporter substrate-binding protein [Stellaceae bacterium]
MPTTEGRAARMQQIPATREEFVRNSGILLSLGAGAVILCGVIQAASAQDKVKLAIVAEITGGGAPSGTMFRDGVLLGIGDVNKSGGILGKQLEASVADTQSDPPTSVAVMRRTVNDEPFAIFGTVYSSSTVANMAIARQAGIPQFSGSESVAVVDKGNPNIFLTSYSQAMGFKKLVNWMVKGLKAEKIALIYVNDAFGIGGRTEFKKYLNELGETLVADISTEVQQADFTPELVKVRDSGATHLMVYSHEEEDARLIIQLHQMGLHVQAVGDNLCAQTTINAGGGAINGAKCQVPMTANSPLPAMGKVAEEFEAQYGHLPDHNGFKGYIGVYMLKAAVERVGTWNQQKLRDCLHDNLFTAADTSGLLMDTYIFGNGDADRESFIVEIKNGKPVVSQVLGLVGGPYKKHSCT